MLSLNINEILEVIDGQLLSSSDNIAEFNNVSTDTRSIKQGDIFFALKGDRFNGNQYINTALDNGASLCIIDEVLIDVKSLEGKANLILVKDSILALGQLAKYYLNKMNVKVIGVTGSVGKTSTKDMLAASLSKKYKVLKTLGNFNNHIGLPLTIFRLDSSYDVAILEMGMSHANEIDYLAEIARPNIMVITNIGLSHIENLGSQENILKAKMESTHYFDKNNVLILNNDDALLSTVQSDLFKVIKTGTTSNCDVFAEDIVLETLSSSFNVECFGNKLSCSLDLPGKHNIINYLLAIAVCKELDVSTDLMIEGMKNLEKTSMRLDITNVNGYTIINDCYNASPDSMKSAIDVQKNIGAERNIAVLGPMYELGDMSDVSHKDVANYVLDKNIDMVFTCGEYTENYKSILADKCKHFDCKEALSEELTKYIRKGDSILIKASRGAKFEYIYNEIKK